MEGDGRKTSDDLSHICHNKIYENYAYGISMMNILNKVLRMRDELTCL